MMRLISLSVRVMFIVWLMASQGWIDFDIERPDPIRLTKINEALTP